VAEAIGAARCILTQDLDFSAIVALSGRAVPSVISLRVASSTVEWVNAALQEVLPTLESAVRAGVIVTVQDTRVRLRQLPLP
jgi:predicted nuclease of predicted toxin-antitoxin system